MTSATTQHGFSIDGRYFAAAVVFLCLGLIVAGALLEQQPVVAAAAVGMVPCCWFALSRPNSVVPLVLFLMYSNAVVVGVHFHGLPPVAAILVPVPLCIPLFTQVVLKRQAIVIGPAVPWLVGLIGWQLVSTLFSRDPDTAIQGVLSTVLEGLLMYLLVTNTIRTPETLRQSVMALVAAGVLMGGISVIQQATGSFHSDFGGFGQLGEGDGFEVTDGGATTVHRRLSGPIGEKNRYAQIMLMLIPLAASRIWIAGSVSKRSAAVMCAFLVAAGCALTFSRSGALAFAVMLLIAVGLKVISRKQVLLMGLGGLMVLLAVPQYNARLATLPAALGIFGRSTGPVEPDGAVRGRATEMLAATRMAIDHPVFGVGPDLSGTYTREYGQAGGLRALEGHRETHCMFLEIPAETGLPGFVLFLGMLTAVIRSLLFQRRQIPAQEAELQHTASAFVLALAGYLVMGVFLHLSYVRYFWLMLALADACTCVIRTHTGRPRQQPVEECGI